VETARDWAHEEFRHASIDDARWRRRLVQMAAQAVRRPAGRVSEAFGDDASRQGAYGLLESKLVGATEVGAGMFAACALRSAQYPFVFCPVDGTSLSLVDRARRKDFGSVGTRCQRARGLKVINAMVLSPDGVALGMGGQKWWPRSSRRRRKNRDQLQPRQKEIGHWLDVMQQVREVMGSRAPETRCWFQLDREGDAWPILSEAGKDGHWFTIRASHNRRVLVGSRGKSKLRSVLAKQPILATSTLSVAPGPNRRGRQANLVIRACPLTLDFRDKQTGRRFSMSLNVVQIRELGSTPKGEKPIEWTLLTNHPISHRRDLFDVLLGYSMRWRIEEMHRTWKSGACRVEETQLRSSSAVIKWASILCAVAVRIERIKQLSRKEPKRPATDEFTPLEIRAVALLRFGKAAKTKVPEGTVPSIEDVTLWIAQIGGYTGRASSGGPPGSITIARGLKDVRATVKALEALQ
jgi:Transposase DNA-binding